MSVSFWFYADDFNFNFGGMICSVYLVILQYLSTLTSYNVVMYNYQKVKVKQYIYIYILKKRPIVYFLLLPQQC